MSELTIFTNNKNLQPIVFDVDDFADNKMASAGITAFMPSLRIDGKSFCLIQNGEKTPVGAAVQGVIVGVGTVAKRFYEEAFSGKDNIAPRCASANGETPDKAIQDPFCSTCALCPNNAWGSDQSMTGKDTKACKDHRRLVIHIPSPAGSTLFRLDVPAASLKSFAAYCNRLSTAGMPLSCVVTKVTFDANEVFPKLAFDAVQTLNQETYDAIKLIRRSPEIDQVLTMEVNVVAASEAVVETPKKPILKKRTAIINEAITATQSVVSGIPTMTQKFESELDATLDKIGQ